MENKPTPKRSAGQPLKNTKDVEPDKLYRTDVTLSGKNRRFLEKLHSLDGKAASTRLREILDWMEDKWEGSRK